MDSLSSMRSLSTTTPGRKQKSSIQERWNNNWNYNKNKTNNLPSISALPLIDDSSSSSNRQHGINEDNSERMMGNNSNRSTGGMGNSSRGSGMGNSSSKRGISSRRKITATTATTTPLELNNSGNSLNGPSSPSSLPPPLPIRSPVRKVKSASATIPLSPTTKSSSTKNINTASSSLSNNGISKISREFLLEQGYTNGLLDAITKNKKEFPLCIWIIDNSISMNKRDGHRIDSSTTIIGDVKFTKCSRWEELQQTLDYHAQMAALINSPTFFRMINPPDNHNLNLSTTKSSSKLNGSKTSSSASDRYHIPQQFSIAAHNTNNQSTTSTTPTTNTTPSSATKLYKTYDALSNSNRGYSSRRTIEQSINSVNSSNSNSPNSNKKHLYEALDIAQRTIQSVRPCGVGTPLAQCLRDVRDGLSSIQTQFQHILTKGKRFAIIIATDGIPTDIDDNDNNKINTVYQNDFINELNILMNTFPVWIVLRLCTDDDKVVNYWNNFDNLIVINQNNDPNNHNNNNNNSSLMDVLSSPMKNKNSKNNINPMITSNSSSSSILSPNVSSSTLCDMTDESTSYNHLNSKTTPTIGIEVLDDYVSEAKEVFRYNKWLNYGLPLHRLREMGFYNDIFDLLDERTLNANEIIQFCYILFGKTIMMKAPCNNNTTIQNDNIDKFTKFLEQHMISNERMLYNPMKRRMESWLNIKELRKVLYNDMKINRISRFHHNTYNNNRISISSLPSISESVNNNNKNGITGLTPSLSLQHIPMTKIQQQQQNHNVTPLSPFKKFKKKLFSQSSSSIPSFNNDNMSSSQAFSTTTDDHHYRINEEEDEVQQTPPSSPPPQNIEKTINYHTKTSSSSLQRVELPLLYTSDSSLPIYQQEDQKQQKRQQRSRSEQVLEKSSSIQQQQSWPQTESEQQKQEPQRHASPTCAPISPMKKRITWFRRRTSLT